MVYFDYRDRFRGDVGQVDWGGLNRYNNCSPTAHLNCWNAITGQFPCSPQTITNIDYGVNYVGGEAFLDSVGFILSRPDLFPDPPYINVNSVDWSMVLGVLADWGAQGFPMVGSFHCDVNGLILPYQTAFQHASTPTYLDDDNVVIWNAEGYEQTLSRADFVNAFTGGLTVFHRTCVPATPVPAPPPPPPYKEEDDMYQNLTQPWAIAVAPNTNFNLVSIADGGVTVDSCKSDGTPVSSKHYALSGNQPNVKGPTEAFDSAAGLGLVDGGVLYFIPDSGTSATLWLHREG